MRALSRPAVAGACLALAVLAPAVPRLGARASTPVAGPAAERMPLGSLRLYKLDALGNGLRALDPRSLADLPHAPVLRTGPQQDVRVNRAPSFAVTPDGSVFAALYTKRVRNGIAGARDMTLQLFDGRTGKPMTGRYHPAIPFWMWGISANGTRLFGMRSDTDFNAPCPAPCPGTVFYVLDARTGRVLHRTTLEAMQSGQPFFADANLHHLYVMHEPDQTSACGARNDRALTITAYSLDSGKRLARSRLKGVRAGTWITKRVVHNQTVVDYQNPGFALSPDGSQLAILDGSSDTLTPLRTPSLQVEASERVSAASSVWTEMADILGLAPDAAEAKGETEGMRLMMQYTADGRSLLVTGSRTWIDPSKRFPISAPLSLRLIDVATGQVEASLASRKQIDSMWAAPDGSAVYTLVPGTSTPQICPCTIRRHDPSTLKVLASRTFWNDSGLQIYFLQGSHHLASHDRTGGGRATPRGYPIRPYENGAGDGATGLRFAARD